MYGRCNAYQFGLPPMFIGQLELMYHHTAIRTNMIATMHIAATAAQWRQVKSRTFIP
jgi:hypothetical protein